MAMNCLTLLPPRLPKNSGNNSNLATACRWRNISRAFRAKTTKKWPHEPQAPSLSQGYLPGLQELAVPVQQCGPVSRLLPPEEETGVPESRDRVPEELGQEVELGSSGERDEENMKPSLAIDLFCGLGGWTEGLLAEGWYVVGFDIERHVYGEHRYPAQLVLQDVLTLHGSQFKDAALIVASPPCQAYSYRAMPWSRAKALPPPDNTLFEACFRIQREAIAAAGRHIPLVVENVRGAQKWVGRARWNFGSFYLWGDVPALMPITLGRWVMKAGAHRSDGATNFHGHKLTGGKLPDGQWSGFADNGG